MNLERRNALRSTTILAGAGLALAACAASGTTTGTTTSVEQVIAQIQAVLAYATPLVPLIGIFAPAAMAFEPAVTSALNSALQIFNTVSSSMTVAQAQPIVSQINTYIQTAITAAGQAIAAIPNASQQAQAKAILTEVSQGAALLETFITGVANVTAKKLSAGVPVMPVRHVQ